MSLEICEICKVSEVGYICVCEEQRVCDRCLVSHVKAKGEQRHRPVSISHPLLNLLNEATQEIEQSTDRLTSTSIESQIKSLEALRDKSMLIINQKISDLQKQLKASFESPKKVHRKSLSVYSYSEKVTKSTGSKNLKFVISGPASVGKSELISSFLSRDKDSYTRRSLNSITKKVIIGEETLNISIWEANPISQYKSITRSYYLQSSILAFVFNLCKKESFEALDSIIKEGTMTAGTGATVCIIGTHLDEALNCRQIPYEIAQSLAFSLNGHYEELNTQDRPRVLQLFKHLIHQVHCKSHLNLNPPS